ncbi:hypothetical protein AVEN_17187-1 [Araneus ventricosus]|uniref:Uncharacterized protein n=1 Tax=Araneus ventricosus TaxID=182803 RepID=A0A4Y2DT10_ARAVE|nr:hypothetical protein AVEN_17187-1 [Araneus ventricosus]
MYRRRSSAESGSCPWTGREEETIAPAVDFSPTGATAGNETSQHLLEPLALSIYCYLANRSVSSYPPPSFTLPLLCPHQHRLGFSLFSSSPGPTQHVLFYVNSWSIAVHGLSKRRSLVSLMCCYIREQVHTLAGFERLFCSF